MLSNFFENLDLIRIHRSKSIFVRSLQICIPMIIMIIFTNIRIFHSWFPLGQNLYNFIPRHWSYFPKVITGQKYSLCRKPIMSPIFHCFNLSHTISLYSIKKFNGRQINSSNPIRISNILKLNGCVKFLNSTARLARYIKTF